jgi:ribosomal protein S18 acetylase RimI-like enzyme
MTATGVQHAIRPARGSDAGAIVALLAEIYEEDRWFVGDGPPSAASLGRRIRGEDRSDTRFLVATADRGVAGWLELQRLVPEKLRHVGVLTLAVGRAYRRRGVATGLLRDAYAWARRQGVAKISLSVRANNVAAVALYEREGFVHEGRESRHIRTNEGYEDNLIMALFLHGEPAS